MTRDERQDLGINKWIRANHRATLQWTTGFGKTRAALKIINLLRRNDKTRKVTVVVPSIPLKLQWENVLREADQLMHTEVVVINTMIMRPRFKCSLLILDEIHRYAATTFSRVFEKAIYDFMLGLTATLSRLDGKHILLKRYAPVCDIVTAHEARRNRWISQLREYNLGVEMTSDEREQYNMMKDTFQSMFDKFDNDFTLMKQCSGPCIPYRNEVEGTSLVRYNSPAAVKRAIELGWRGNTPEQAYHIIVENAALRPSERRSVWGGILSHPYHPEKLHIFAINGMRIMGKMKQFVYKLSSKLDAGLEIINAFNTKTITFAEVVETADAIAARIGDQAVVYYSDIKAKVINGMKVSAAKQKRDALNAIRTDLARVLCTAKSLDEGADYPDLALGIIFSFTSAPRQRTQRNGRVGRLHFYEDGEEKEAVIVYIYVKDTKEAQWLQRAQERDAKVIWVDSVREILLREGLLPEEYQAEDWVLNP